MPETKCGFDDSPEGSGTELLISYGPTLLVNIGFDASWKLGSGIPNPSIKNVQALVDTGATESCIDHLLAVQLKLPVIDQRPYAGISGQHLATIYLAQIHVPSLNFTIYGAFAGVNLAEGGIVHKALIGRTFLQSFTMVYDGKTGTVTLSS